MSDSIAQHIKNDFFIKVTQVKNWNGVQVRFPENILTQIPEDLVMYDVDKDEISFYANGQKLRTIKCPNYASRYWVIADIAVKAIQRNISTDLIVCYDAEGNRVQRLVDLLQSPSDPIEVLKEQKLDKQLDEMLTTGNMSSSPDIQEGFNLIALHYLQGVSHYE